MTAIRGPFVLMAALAIIALFSGAVLTTNSIAIAQATPAPGAVCAACSLITVSPQSGAPADGSSAVTVTARLLDSNFNPVPGKTLRGDLGPGVDPSKVTVTPVTGVSNALGWTAFRITSTLAQGFPFTITDQSDGQQIGYVNVSFSPPGATPAPAPSTIPMTPCAACSTAVASPNYGVPADGSHVVTVIVRLINQPQPYSRPVSGKTLMLKASAGGGGGAGVTISPASAQSDAGGAAVFSLRSRSPDVVDYVVYDVTDSLPVAVVEVTFTKPQHLVKPPPTTTPAAATPTPSGDENAWSANAIKYRGRNGQHFRYACPSGGPPFPVGGDNFSGVYGTDTYTDDSPVCLAAVHAGLIALKSGGEVTIEIRPRAESYTGSTRNGITSIDYGTCECGSYVFLGGAGSLPRLR